MKLVMPFVLGIALTALTAASKCYADQTITCTRLGESVLTHPENDGTGQEEVGMGYTLAANDTDAKPYVDPIDGRLIRLPMYFVQTNLTKEQAGIDTTIAAGVADPIHGRGVTNLYRLSENQTLQFPIDFGIPQENIAIHFDCTAVRKEN